MSFQQFSLDNENQRVARALTAFSPISNIRAASASALAPITNIPNPNPLCMESLTLLAAYLRTAGLTVPPPTCAPPVDRTNLAKTVLLDILAHLEKAASFRSREEFEAYYQVNRAPPFGVWVAEGDKSWILGKYRTKEEEGVIRGFVEGARGRGLLV